MANDLYYIPLDIGAWLKDTSCVSMDTQGCLLNLIFKLWDSKAKGLLLISFSQLSILWRKTPEECHKIIAEIQQNDLLNVEFLPENMVKFESRKMLKSASKSLKMSANGKLGGRPKKAIEKQTESKLKTKTKQNPNYNSNFNSNYKSENKRKEGAGEKQNFAPEIITYLNELNGTNFRTDTKATCRLIDQRIGEGYTVQELKEIVEYKIAEWKGTDQEKWLQPDTLFNGEKCAKYRNQVQAAKDKGMSISQIKGKGKVKPDMGELIKLAHQKSQFT